MLVYILGSMGPSSSLPTRVALPGFALQARLLYRLNMTMNMHNVMGVRCPAQFDSPELASLFVGSAVAECRRLADWGPREVVLVDRGIMSHRV